VNNTKLTANCEYENGKLAAWCAYIAHEKFDGQSMAQGHVEQLRLGQ